MMLRPNSSAWNSFLDLSSMPVKPFTLIYNSDKDERVETFMSFLPSLESIVSSPNGLELTH